MRWTSFPTPLLGLSLLAAAGCAPAEAVLEQTPDELIALALTAAPPEIAARATVADLEGTVLRQGTDEWTCIPVPDAPMCLDRVWMAWFDAYVGQETPPPMGLGVAYMLAGDGGASNVDPFATGPAPGNDWVVSGPHLMLLVPDAQALDALSTDHHHGGPFVMWKGTPYVHAMVPVPAQAAR